jgi:putative photosynthetic complex assembly protein 2
VYVPVQPASFGFATQAVLAMLWYQLLMLAALAVSWAATRGRVNRTGWWGLLLFYTTHQLACISIFFGVANPGRGFFPKHLEFLESYFGPAQNSLFLPAATAVILLLTLGFAVKALRDVTPMRRQSLSLLTVLGTLGVIELMVLGLAIDLRLWDTFLEFRGY